MTLRLAVSLLLIFAALACRARPDEREDSSQMRRLDVARKLLDAGKPDEAINTEIDAVLRYFEKKYASEPRKIYCARTSVESSRSRSQKTMR